MIKKIATNTIAQVLSKASTAIISIFLIKILTNYLDIEWYGLYSKIYNYLWIFAFLADLWLYTIWIREISNNKDDAEKIAWNILTLRTITWFLIILIAFVLGLFLPWYDSGLALISILIVWLFTVVSLINSSILSAMHAFLESEKSIISTIVWKIVNIWMVLGIVFWVYPSWWDHSYETSFLWIMSAWFFWVLVMTILNYYFSRETLKIRYRFDWDYIKYIFIISLPYGLALFLSTLYTKIDLVLLSLMEGDSWDTSVALYNVPLKIADVAMFFGVMFLSSMLPFFTKYYNSWDKEKFTFIVKESFKILTSLGFIFVSLWILFRDNIIQIIANSDYINHEIFKYTSSDWMMIVLFVLFFYFLSQLFIYILIAAEKQSFLLKANIVVTIFNIVWNLLLIPHYSFVGAGVVTVLSQIILSFIIYFKVKWKIFNILDLGYLISSIFISICVFILWKFLLDTYSFWYILDVFIFWIPLTIIYAILLYKLFFKRTFRELKTLKL